MSNVAFERHVLEVRRKLVPANSPHLTAMVKNFDYEEVGEDDLTLPGWCSVDLNKYINFERSTINKIFIAGKPNRQETLYWMDRFGTKLYALLLQANLIFIGVDTAMQATMFLPFMWRDAPWSMTVPYFILTFLSILGNMLNKKHLISTIAVISSVGCYRCMGTIADVYREQKTENLVRCFLIIYRLRRFAFEAQADPKKISQGDQNHYTKKLDPLEILEVSQTFKSFSHDSEVVDMKQFEQLMTTLGGEVSKEALANMVSSLDADNDGEVTKEEFLQWYSDNMFREDSRTMREAPRVLFQLFDQDKNGELTISQFKTKLDALQVGFSVDEQIAIVNELDKNGNGRIGLHEFELLFRKFPPTELRSVSEKFEYFPGELCTVATCHAFV